MSTSQLQAALVSLIRYPELNRDERLDEFLARFELTPKEEGQVRALAASYHVKKFGRDQRATRFDLSVKGALPLTGRVVGYKKMARDIYGIRFEPRHEGLAVEEMAQTFARFFIANAETFVRELELPPFAGDLARYELAEYWIKGPTARDDWKLPQGSLLRPDTPLRIEELGHDMVSFVERVRKLDDESITRAVPERRDTIVLFARVPNTRNPEAFFSKQFEIDATLRDFLRSEMNAATLGSTPLPPCFADLVELGICRAARESCGTA